MFHFLSTLVSDATDLLIILTITYIRLQNFRKYAFLLHTSAILVGFYFHFMKLELVMRLSVIVLDDYIYEIKLKKNTLACRYR